MRKTVVISKDSVIDEDMDYLELHVDDCFKLAEKLNLNPEYKERTYLGRFLAQNGYVVMQIADYEATIYIPNEIDNNQLNNILDYIDRDSKYYIVDDRFEKYGEIKTDYFGLLKYINSLKVKTLKRSM